LINHKLSIFKSVIWRCIGIVILASITYFFTRKLITTTYITVVHHAKFLVVFYLHERFFIWLKKPYHWIKPFTYEIILGMGLGGLIVYSFTGSFTRVTQVTGTYTFVKIITYFIYDRIWARIKK